MKLWKFLYLAVDGWTDAQHCPTLGATALFPGKRPVLLSFDRCWSRETGEALADHLKKNVAYMQELGLQVYGIVADNAPNIQSALDCLEATGILNLRCIAHVGNKLLEKLAGNLSGNVLSNRELFEMVLLKLRNERCSSDTFNGMGWVWQSFEWSEADHLLSNLKPVADFIETVESDSVNLVEVVGLYIPVRKHITEAISNHQPARPQKVQEYLEIRDPGPGLFDACLVLEQLAASFATCPSWNHCVRLPRQRCKRRTAVECSKPVLLCELWAVILPVWSTNMVYFLKEKRGTYLHLHTKLWLIKEITR